MDFPKYDSPPPPPPPTFRADMNLKEGTLHIVCDDTNNVTMKEVEKGLWEMMRSVQAKSAKDEIKNKAIPATGKQKYYFAMYLFRSSKSDELIPVRSQNFIDIEVLKKEMNDRCNAMNVEYFEFEY